MLSVVVCKSDQKGLYYEDILYDVCVFCIYWNFKSHRNIYNSSCYATLYIFYIALNTVKMTMLSDENHLS